MRIHSPQITGSAENTNIVTTTRITSLSALSASFASTASYANNFTVGGTLTAQTINVQTITSSIDYVTGSSINGSLLANTHQFTGSILMTGSLTVSGSVSTNNGFYVSNTSMNFGPNGANSLSLGNSAGVLSLSSTTLSLGSNTTTRTNLFGATIITGSFAVSGSVNINGSLTVSGSSVFSGSVTSTVGFTGSLQGTSSYAAQANSASFALTASYISGSGAGVGFPFSGSAIITGSLFVSGSTISGSFVGDGSGITGLTAGGKIHTQSSAASTWTVTHNLGVQYPNVTVYDNNNNVIIPQTIVATDANTLTLTFGSAVAGYAVSGIGGIINVQGRTTQQYFTASTTWSFAHNLGDKYVSLQAFDDAFEMMIPTTIRLVDFTSSLLLFDSASSGYAVATIGGDLPAISSSYAGYTLQVANSAPYSASWVAVPNVTVTNAQTASYANNFTVSGSLNSSNITLSQPNTGGSIDNKAYLRLVNTGTSTISQSIDLVMRWQDGTYNGTGGVSMIRESATARSGKLILQPIDSSGNNISAMVLTSTGLVDLPYGQIKFPSSQNASSDANTLDDYEEGTWTPVIGGEGGQSGQSYSGQTGYYTKIGRIVTVTFRVVLTNKGTITGNAAIKGLPFTVDGSGVSHGAGVTYFEGLATSWSSIFLMATGGQTYATIDGVKSAATLTTRATTSDIGNSTQFNGSFTYFV
jgi:hypothetical protein